MWTTPPAFSVVDNATFGRTWPKVATWHQVARPWRSSDMQLWSRPVAGLPMGPWSPWAGSLEVFGAELWGYHTSNDGMFHIKWPPSNHLAIGIPPWRAGNHQIPIQEKLSSWDSLRYFELLNDVPNKYPIMSEKVRTSPVYRDIGLRTSPWINDELNFGRFFNIQVKKYECCGTRCFKLMSFTKTWRTKIWQHLQAERDNLVYETINYKYFPPATSRNHGYYLMFLNINYTS